MAKMTKADIQKRQLEIMTKMDEMDEKTNAREAKMRALTSEEQKGTITEEQKRELEALKAEQRSQDIEYDALVRESAGLSARAKAMATGKELEQIREREDYGAKIREMVNDCFTNRRAANATTILANAITEGADQNEHANLEAGGLIPVEIRPIIDNQDNRPIDWSQVNPSQTLIYGEQALGIGRMNELKNIVYIKNEQFSSLVTERIAEELLALNRTLRDKGESYILVGPGRWGTSDPFLGVPVKWTHISEAKVIVECGIPSFEIEPSQGTHFFQNVTSLGVGYLTINPFRGEGLFCKEELDRRKATYEGEYLRRVSFDEPLEVIIDGRSNRGIVLETKKE